MSIIEWYRHKLLIFCLAALLLRNLARSPRQPASSQGQGCLLNLSVYFLVLVLCRLVLFLMLARHSPKQPVQCQL